MSSRGSTSKRASGDRRTPVQHRSQETFERILDGASVVLVDRGLDGFTTIAIAAQADINVATIYSYFVDKYAILREMSDRYEQLREQYVEESIARLAEGADWRAVFNEIIDGLVQFRIDYPGGMELRRAMLTIPDFRHVDLDFHGRMARVVAAGLRARSGGLRPRAALRMARVLNLAVHSTLDEACADGTVDKDLVKGLKVMVSAYAATELDD